MTNPPELLERVVALESKIMYLEHELAQLNSAVLDQVREIRTLKTAVQRIKQQTAEPNDDDREN